MTWVYSRFTGFAGLKGLIIVLTGLTGIRFRVLGFGAYRVMFRRFRV